MLDNKVIEHKDDTNRAAPAVPITKPKPKPLPNVPSRPPIVGESASESAKKNKNKNKNQQKPKQNKQTQNPKAEEKIFNEKPKFLNDFRTSLPQHGGPFTLPEDFRLPQQKLYFKLDRPMNLAQHKLDIINQWWDLSNKEPIPLEWGHPLAAATRDIAEHIAIEKCVLECASHDVHEGLILDVGGNSWRHKEMRRPYIHACNPDATKVSKDNGCCRDLQSCLDECWPRHLDDVRSLPCPLVSFSTHAIYYLTPKDLEALMERSFLPIHYAVHHRFDPDEKELCEGELTYSLDPDYVDCRAAGNTMIYRHRRIEWMMEPLQVGEWHIVCEEVGRIGDQVISKLVGTKTPPPRKLIKTLVHVEDQSFEPEVYDAACVFAVGAKRESGYPLKQFMEQFPRYCRDRKINIDYSRIGSKSKWMTTLFYATLKEEVANKINTTTTSYTEDLAKLSLLNKAADIPIPILPGLLMSFAFSLICVVFYGLFRSTCSDTIQLARVAACENYYRAEILAKHWIVQKTVPYVNELLIGYHQWLSGCDHVRFSVPKFECVLETTVKTLVQNWLLVIAFLIVCVASILVRQGVKLGINTFRGWIRLPLRLRLLNIFKVRDVCCPTNDYDLDPSAKIKTPVEKPCQPTSYIQLFGIGVLQYIPLYPRRCWHMVYSAIAGRVCRRKVGDKEWTITMVPKWLMGFFCDLGNGLQEYDIDSWAAKKGTTQEDAFWKEYLAPLNLATKYIPPWMSNGFVKMEKYLGKLYFDARAILAASASYNGEVSPFIAFVQKRFTECFDHTNPYMFYASKTTAETVGKAVHDRYLACRNPKLGKNDFSRMDCSIKPSARRIMQTLYELAGATVKVLSLLVTRMRTLVIFKTKVGKFSVEVDGNTRSGDPDTTLANTCYTAIITDWVARLLRLIWWILVCGDDSVTVFDMPEHLTEAQIIEEANAISKRYGLRGDFQIVPIEQLTFCSSLFYPVGNTWIMGPMPGRLLSKTFWDTKNLCKRMAEEWTGEVAYGLLRDVSFIPVLRVAVGRIAERYQAKRPRIESWADKIHAEHWHEADESTWDFMAKRYGVTVNQLRELEEYLEKIDIPCLVDHPVLEQMAYVDIGGVKNLLVDTLEEFELPKLDLFHTYQWWAPTLEELFKRICVTFILAYCSWYNTLFWNIPASARVSDEVANGLALLVGFIFGSAEAIANDHDMMGTIVGVTMHMLLTVMRLDLAIIFHTLWNFVLVPLAHERVDELSMVTSKKAKKQSKSSAKPKPKKKNGMGNVIKDGASIIGGILAGPTGARLGSKIGALGAKLIGQGAYKIKTNTLQNGNKPPSFSDAGDFGQVNFKFREFLGDLVGSVAFASTTYDVSIANPAMCPYGNQLARMFAKVRYRGFGIYYKPSSGFALNSTNTAQGTVIVSTQYDPDAPAFVNKMQMENTEFSDSTVPFEPIMHLIECDPSSLPVEKFFTTYNYNSSDQRFVDLAKVTIATQGMQGANVIGEMWAVYDVDFFEPKELSTPGAGLSVQIYNNSYANNSPLGSTNTVTYYGGLSQLIHLANSVSLVFNNNVSTYLPPGSYQVNLIWYGSNTVTGALPTITPVNCAYNSTWWNDVQYTSGTTAGSNVVQNTFVVDILANNAAAPASITFGTGGTLPTGTQALWITIQAVFQNNANAY